MRQFDLRLACGVSALALGIAAGLPAFAQSTGDRATSDKGTQVDEVVVTGIRKSLQTALAVKQTSDKVIEAISADDIGALPDVTIAESIARLPGVNATRDRGNDSQAVVRGLGPRLVLGTVNGREVASSEPDRNVRWEIYPSEVVSGVQVYKSQSADLIAGGVAATINISTVSPLEYKGPTFVFRGGAVYYDKAADIPNYSPWGYRGSGAFVGRVNDDLAVALGVSIQKQKNAYPSLQGWGYNDSTIRAGDNSGDLNGDGHVDATPWGAQTEVKKLDEDRLGLMGAIEWAPSDNFTLKFDGLYSKIRISEDQDQTWFGNNGVTGNWGNGNFGAYNGAGSSYTLVNNTVVAATLNNAFTSVTNVIAHYSEDKTLTVLGLNGRWRGDGWTIAGDISYSKAERDNTWQAVLTELYPNTLSFDWRDGVTPFVTVSSNTADPTIQFAPGYRPGIHDGPEHLGDELTAVALDFKRDFGDEGFTSAEFGLRGSDRTKDHTRTSWNQPVLGGGVLLPANLLYSYNAPGLNVPGVLTTNNFGALVTAAYGPGGFNSALAFNDPLQAWSVQERDYEGYAKLNFRHDAFGVPMSGNIGVRVVNVRNTSDGNQSVAGVVTPASVSSSYTEVLPSASLNFDVADHQILRVGLARVIARPPLDELRVSRNLSDPLVPPRTGSDGNPHLEPFKATQLDVSWEWYFHPESLLAVSTYYKDVDSNIGYQQQNVTVNGISYLITGPFNGQGGSIKGVELTFQTPFYFVPGLKNFGIYANYAFVDSSIKEFSPIGHPLSANGLAKNTATVDLWYNNGPLELRLGYKYHSAFTVIYGWNGADLQTLQSESTLGFSASYQVTKSIQVRFQADNLTDEPLRIFRDNDPNRLGRYDTYGRRYLLDVSFKY
ncbi:MAG: TonB-dependent receptor [Caulobacter sp.]|nr:TonB-dependent receptor [Caulobacter sp.]